MCGAFSFTTRSKALADLYPWLELDERLPESYNIRPTQLASVVINQPNEATNWPTKKPLKLMQFGFEASWSSRPLFNTRDDKLLSGKGFWKPFQNNRCVIFADGFFEWTGPKGDRQPYYIQVEGGRPFVFAGIFKLDDSKGYFSILTTTPNTLVGELHNRMPVILPDEKVENWLSSEEMELEKIGSFLSQYPAEEMSSFKVSKEVGNVRNNSPELIEPIKN